MGRVKAQGKKEATEEKSKRVNIESLNFSRAGMPAKDSITRVEEFKKGKQTYRIIHTNEVDEYENESNPPSGSPKVQEHRSKSMPRKTSPKR